jgi:histidinol dehydrogenase
MAVPPKISLTIPSIDCARDDARSLIDELRNRLSPRGDIVSEAARQRTIDLFGAELTPQQVVERICRDVQRLGLPAVLDYTARLDSKSLTPQTLRVTDAELEAARRQVAPAFLETVRRIVENVASFQSVLLPRDARLVRATAGGGRIELRQRYLPLKRVGICIPGGAAAYPSTLMMTAIPAKVAGVREIAVVVPPTPFGGYNNDILAVCRELEITEVYRVGGAQGVAALAYGVEGIERVDKIVGPGNLFVALAKRFVFGEVDIDCIAGPSEVVVLADETARPEFVASDLICQAEHSPGSAVLITWHAPLIDQVRAALEEQLRHVDRGNLARASLEQFGALVLARDADEAARLSDLLAPEHLHISTSQPEALLNKVQNAGAIFLGHHTPVAVGDYLAGPSHVLPTGGTARFANGLCATDFLKRSSILDFDRQALASVADDVRLMAAKESLTAHSASVDIRFGASRDGAPPETPASIE